MTLQEQAEKLISNLGLVERLTQFGEVHIVGNVAFKTTTKPDIDIQIYSDLHYEDAGALIVKELANLGLTDIQERRLKKSKKYLILAKIEDDGIVWDIDIALTQPSTDYIRDSYRFYMDYSPKLTEDNTNTIINFKKVFGDKKVAGDNSAYYIYLGVLDGGITTNTEMKQYLSEMKRNR